MIEQALVKEKNSPEQTEKSSSNVKPKQGSLVDLFGRRVAKNVGTLMDKVHKSLFSFLFFFFLSLDKVHKSLWQAGGEECGDLDGQGTQISFFFFILFFSLFGQGTQISLASGWRRMWGP
jgi:hypothetical protein